MLDYLASHILVSQHIRDASVSFPTLDHHVEESARNVALLSSRVHNCIEKFLHISRPKGHGLQSPIFAMHKIAIWPLWLIGSDLQTPAEDIEWVLVNLEHIASTPGCEAAVLLRHATIKKHGVCRAQKRDTFEPKSHTDRTAS